MASPTSDDKGKNFLVTWEKNLKNSHKPRNFLYKELTEAARIARDAEFGISTKAVVNDEGKTIWLRDATEANETISSNSPRIETYNTLLRCLTRLRAIDYAISKKYGYSAYHPLYDALQELIGKLKTMQNNKDMEESKILAMLKFAEKQFNTELIEALYDSNLTKGCETIDEAENLLSHYRNLSSLLDPASILTTLTYDNEAQVLHCETQYPVTKKTAVQKEAIKEVKEEINWRPFKEDKNYHNVDNIAMQEADNLFADLLSADDRLLPAQARKTHLVGVKNAFIVKNELIRLNNLDDAKTEGEWDFNKIQQKKDDTLWLARTGAPVYIGKGENFGRIQQHTKENLEQIRLAAAEYKGAADAKALKLHVTCLNTDSPLENQHTIVQHLHRATHDQKDDMSLISTNLEGLLRPLDLSPSLQFKKNEHKPWGIAFLQKATRLLDSAVPTILKASEKDNTISVVNCASGQDRTGTAISATILAWIKNWYKNNELPSDNIEKNYVNGRNTAEIASHLVPGSFGMKKDSVANNMLNKRRVFSREATKELYLKSADSNKKNTVGDVSFLKKTSKRAIEEYDQYSRLFSEQVNSSAINKDEASQNLREQGKRILLNIKKIADKDKYTLRANELTELSFILKNCTDLLKNPGNNKATKQLLSLSQSTPWKTLGIALLAFTAFALIAVGVLTFIPSGGTSLFAAIAVAVGISAKVSTIATGSTIMATGIAGGGFSFLKANKNNLNAAVKNFAETADKENSQEKPKMK